MEKVVLVTGCNAGIGYALVERLLDHYGVSVTICMACRNLKKMKESRSRLLEKFPDCALDILVMDTSYMKSVLQAAKVVTQKYSHIDVVYLNAGVLQVSGLDWSRLCRGLFSLNCLHMFATGDGIMKQEDDWTSEGYRQVFATNLLGHFVFVESVQEVLGGPDQPSQIIWTSSSNAMKKDFSIEDIQHANGQQPYGSSKYATDLLSVSINHRYNVKNVYSHTTCPGLVLTNMTRRIIPGWLWCLLVPLFCLLRLLLPSMTLTVENACHSLFWLSTQEPASLDPLAKYHTCATACGHIYTKHKQMDVDCDTAEVLMEKLQHMYGDVTS